MTFFQRRSHLRNIRRLHRLIDERPQIVAELTAAREQAAWDRHSSHADERQESADLDRQADRLRAHLVAVDAEIAKLRIKTSDSDA